MAVHTADTDPYFFIYYYIRYYIRALTLTMSNGPFTARHATSQRIRLFDFPKRNNGWYNIIYIVHAHGWKEVSFEGCRF